MYNIIIPVTYKDYSFLNLTIQYICKNLDPKSIYIITDEKFSRYLPTNIKKNPLCKIISENSLLEGLTYHYVDSIIKSQGREHTKTGWFFQQFLKMAFALSAYCDEDYYLSWDADTLPLQKLSFFDEDGIPYFTMKSEYHKPYFEAINRLLKINKNNPRSYISEHMMFKKEIMCELLETINCSDVSGNVWYEKILNSIVPETVSTNSFSEFETYGTYCNCYYPNEYKERQLPSFRKAALIQGRLVSDETLKKISSDVCIASFEIYDRPPFPWGFICHWYEELRNYKERALRFLIR